MSTIFAGRILKSISGHRVIRRYKQAISCQLKLETQNASLATQALLKGAVDYAGLFPPASLSLEKAVENYSAYRLGPYAWMLGRFILSASRLPQFAAVMSNVQKNDSQWQISALVGKDFESDIEFITKFNRDSIHPASVDTIELAQELFGKVEALAPEIFGNFTVYSELPLDAPTDSLHALAEKGARAKIRTGGIKPEAIPSTHDIAVFIVNCVKAKASFKATAGLHHPLRSIRPLTYESNAVTGEMHGFINVFLASAAAISGECVDFVNDILADTKASSFSFTDSRIRCKQHSFSATTLRKTRENLLLSFGSCSFDEPVEELASLGWL
jgi:hypothetical protein